MRPRSRSKRPPEPQAAKAMAGRSRIVTRGGESLGQLPVREGLAESWGGARVVWC